MRTRTIPRLALALGLVTALMGCEGIETLAPEAESLGTAELSVLLSEATENGPVFDTGTDTTTALAGEPRADGEGRPHPQRPGKSIFQELADEVPSFGGLYRSGHCVVAVVLTDLSTAVRAVEVVKQVIEPLVERGCPEGIRVEPAQGQYTYFELLRIRRALRPLDQIRGVVGARIDFEQNKVIIGVVTREVFDEVWRALERIGAPRDALGVELIARPR